MNKKSLCMVAAAALALAEAGHSAAISAGPIDGPQGTGGVESGTTSTFVGVGSAAGYCSPSQAVDFPFTAPFCATLTMDLVPRPSMTVSLTAFPQDLSGLTDNASRSDAGGVLAYFYAVIGPATTRAIPLVLNTFVEVDDGTFNPVCNCSNGTLTYAAGIHLRGVDANRNFTETVREVTPFFPQGTELLTINALVGTEYSIELELQTMVLQSSIPLQAGGAPVTARLVLDPVLSFAPGFDSTGYSLIFSDGVSNGGAAAVPEPATWLLLLTGPFAVLPTLRRAVSGVLPT